MTNDDREYFDGKFEGVDAKFEGVHGRITQLERGTTAALNDHAVKDLEAHARQDNRIDAQAVGALQLLHRHKDDDHNPAKFWGLLASIVAVVTALSYGVVWALNHVK